MGFEYLNFYGETTKKERGQIIAQIKYYRFKERLYC